MSQLSGQERGEVVGDFSRGKAHFTMWFQLKFSHWLELPWCLVGIAHWDAAKARESAARSLRLFVGSPRSPDQHHPLSLALCHPEGLCYEEMVSFAT
eukprot:5018197-Pyramimonas_sp.AAC.1